MGWGDVALVGSIAPLNHFCFSNVAVHLLPCPASPVENKVGKERKEKELNTILEAALSGLYTGILA